ncbi:MAG: S8 family peptidase [Agathobacter sp.]|nr:S8 family peptidase [Agathobacter sp.]
MQFKKMISMLMAVVLCCNITPYIVKAQEKVTKEDRYEENVNGEDIRLIVTYKDDVSEETKKEILNENGVETQDVVENFDTCHIIVLEIDEKKANEVRNKLQSNPNIEDVQPDCRICIDDFDKATNITNSKTVESLFKEPFYSYQWGLKNNGQNIYTSGIAGVDTNIENAWTITVGTEEVLVGVLDSGIDINNYDIQDNIYINNGEIPGNGIDDDNNGYIDDVNGWDFYNDDNSVYDSFDEDCHGTYVASIIGSTKNDFGIIGVCQKVKIIPLKFMSTENGGSTVDAIRAIEYAADLGVKVINCSWAGTEYNHALKAAMRHSKILFVCASGNQGKDIDVSPMYPACFNIDNVISVGAIDNKGNIADYSNYGKRNVDVLAPGDGIIGQLPDDMFIISDGTSAAAPFVTGEAALIYSLKPDLKGSKVADYITKNVVKEKKNYSRIKSRGRIDIYQALLYVQNK